MLSFALAGLSLVKSPTYENRLETDTSRVWKQITYLTFRDHWMPLVVFISLLPSCVGSWLMQYPSFILLNDGGLMHTTRFEMCCKSSLINKITIACFTTRALPGRLCTQALIPVI